MRKSDKEIDTRISFHSIESILEHNPHKIKKVFLPANRDEVVEKSIIDSLGRPL